MAGARGAITGRYARWICTVGRIIFNRKNIRPRAP